MKKSCQAKLKGFDSSVGGSETAAAAAQRRGSAEEFSYRLSFGTQSSPLLPQVQGNPRPSQCLAVHAVLLPPSWQPQHLIWDANLEPGIYSFRAKHLWCPRFPVALPQCPTTAFGEPLATESLQQQLPTGVASSRTLILGYYHDSNNGYYQ